MLFFMNKSKCNISKLKWNIQEKERDIGIKEWLFNIIINYDNIYLIGNLNIIFISYFNIC